MTADTNLHNIDDIYKASYQIVEDYLSKSATTYVFRNQTAALGEQVRHLLFPLVVRHLTQDLQAPITVRVENFQRVISQSDSFEFAKSHYKEQHISAVEQFFKSRDFIKMKDELELKTMPIDDDIQKKFLNAYQTYFLKIIMGPTDFNQKETEHQREKNGKTIGRYIQKICTPLPLDDVLQYHQTHIEHLSQKAMDYISVMEQAIKQSFSEVQPLSTDRISARRSTEDTIIIETGEPSETGTVISLPRHAGAP